MNKERAHVLGTAGGPRGQKWSVKSLGRKITFDRFWLLHGVSAPPCMGRQKEQSMDGPRLQLALSASCQAQLHGSNCIFCVQGGGRLHTVRKDFLRKLLLPWSRGLKSWEPPL